MERRAKEIAQAEINKQKAELRTLRSNLEVAQSSARKHASAKERLAEEADAARAERDEARSTVTNVMDESADVRSCDSSPPHVHACCCFRCCLQTCY